MATKTTDTCLAKVKDDEPIFVLRGQDILAAETVRSWAENLCGFHHGAQHHYASCQLPKVKDALQIAQAMDRWPDRKVPD